MAEPTPPTDQTDAVSPVPSTPNGILASKRKRGGASSSRGVANLTPEQLARKRANDREAQRAIRERTKHQIDTLNQRIQELEAQQPYTELQAVVREKDAIQAESNEIKRQLASVISILQPMLGPQAQGLQDITTGSQRHSTSAKNNLTIRFQSPEQPHQQSPGNHQPMSDVASTTTFTDDGQSVRQWSAKPMHQNGRSSTQTDNHFMQDERLGVDFLLHSNQRAKMNYSISPGTPVQTTAQITVPQGQSHNTAPNAMLPNILPATCPLDHIMLDFLAERRAAAARGVPLKTLTGPQYPNFTALLFPDHSFDSHPLSNLFTDILRTFPDIQSLPEQIAVVFIMFLIMRWQIDPSQENYERLPSWMTPRPTALFTPHPSWIDYIPWPKLRDKMSRESPHQPFENFFVAFTTTLSLNWPYEPRDCLIPASSSFNRQSYPFATITTPANFSSHTQINSPNTSSTTVQTPSVGPAPSQDEQWLINPAFESHLRRLRNWSLGPAFAAALPHLGECVAIRQDKP